MIIVWNKKVKYGRKNGKRKRKTAPDRGCDPALNSGEN